MPFTWCWNWIAAHTNPLPLTDRAPPAPPRGRRRPRPQLRLEELESRTVLQGGTWTPLTNLMPDPLGTQSLMLLSDGTVMVQGGDNSPSNLWYQLTPDATGSYINGTWSNLAPMNTMRLFYPSNVLRDGRVFVAGGELTGNSVQDWTNAAEIYDPVTNTWTPIPGVPAPVITLVASEGTNMGQTVTGNLFGDVPTEILPDGSILAGDLTTAATYIYNPATNSWSAGGTKLRNDFSDEETWVKLPDNSILSYDIFSSNNPVVLPGHAQRYIPALNQWVDAGSVPVSLSSAAVGFELGPAFLLPDGRVFQIGGNNNTALYNPATNTWTAGPTIPNGLVADDAPGAILPNGDVIFAADAPTFTPPLQLFEFDFRTNAITPVATPPALTALLSQTPAFVTRMMNLPSGQLAFTLGDDLIWVFTPNGGPQDAWRPTISNIAANGDGTFTLTGTQLNGISEGSIYGDDAENATNYPIIQITDSAGKVLYGRTFNWSSTGVAQDGQIQTVLFTPPAGLTPGPLSVVVIANGIPSLPFTIPAPTSGVRIFYPFRYAYNSQTGIYRGNLTLLNLTPDPIAGRFALVFASLPAGVTLVNQSGTTADGAPFILFTGTLSPDVPFRVTIRLRNPKHRPLSTFYQGFPILVLLDGFASANGTLGTTNLLASSVNLFTAGPAVAPRQPPPVDTNQLREAIIQALGLVPSSKPHH